MEGTPSVILLLLSGGLLGNLPLIPSWTVMEIESQVKTHFSGTRKG